MTGNKHVVIVGGGFAGLFAAQNLAHAKVKVTLVDKRNFHLFQPLLYQVATGGLSPGDIASPLRAILSRQKNATVLQARVTDLDPKAKTLIFEDGNTLNFDYLILATGVRHHYFGNDQWAHNAPGLKTIENALDIRQRVLTAYERAEKETDPIRRATLQRFVIIGAGPTGVELAGALGELNFATMRNNFRSLNLDDTEILLIEGAPNVLAGFPVDLSARAKESLERLGVRVLTSTQVTDIQGKKLTLRHGETVETLEAGTLLWAAGVKASPLCKVLNLRLNAHLDRNGKVLVDENMNVPGYPEIFALGDMAAVLDKEGKPLPGVAPVAMQQGRYAAKTIKSRLQGKALKPFVYKDKGSLAVIGRNAAVAHIGAIKLWGFPAWLLWALVHIHFLVEFGNKAMVSFQWFWNYLTRKRGARLITDGIQDENDEETNAPPPDNGLESPDKEKQQKELLA